MLQALKYLISSKQNNVWIFVTELHFYEDVAGEDALEGSK